MSEMIKLFDNFRPTAVSKIVTTPVATTSSTSGRAWPAAGVISDAAAVRCNPPAIEHHVEMSGFFSGSDHRTNRESKTRGCSRRLSDRV